MDFEEDHSPKKFKHSWRDILVIGEFKASLKCDIRKDTILQLSSYVLEAFRAQPGRRFVHAFTVCGHVARFYFFDHVGVSISTSYDISSKHGQVHFMQAPFMALELLLNLDNHRCHTWRHDLESFFYVLIWSLGSFFIGIWFR